MIGRALSANWSVTLNADASRLVAGAGESLLRIYEPTRAQLLLTVDGGAPLVREVRFLPGEDIVVARAETGVRIRRAASWEEIATAQKAGAQRRDCRSGGATSARLLAARGMCAPAPWAAVTEHSAVTAVAWASTA